MIGKLKMQDFDRIYELMELSFPSDEYRPYDEQKALLNNSAYSIYVLYADSQDIKAFIAVWEFNEFAFIEHFAVHPEHRNGGIGAYMQPPISQGKKAIPLFIMTSGSTVDETVFEQIKGTLYTEVYKCI